MTTVYAALESQLTQIEFWRGGHSDGYSKYLRDMIAGEGLDHLHEVMVDGTLGRLLHATPYFISTEITDLLLGSMDDFPGDIPWRAFWPEAKTGWVYFERPLLVPTDGIGDPMRWRAILWFQPASDVAELAWVVLADSECGNHPGVLEFRLGYRVIDDAKLNDMSKDRNGVTPMVFSTRFLAAFFSFIRQKIVSFQDYRSPRALVRRFQRATHTEAPLVRVIHLRKREVRGRENGDSEQRDWSHRWIVSGHWRKQWYSSRQRHEPLFIDSYVKGPDDKPLKARKVNLYAVVN